MQSAIASARTPCSAPGCSVARGWFAIGSLSATPATPTTGRGLSRSRPRDDGDFGHEDLDELVCSFHAGLIGGILERSGLEAHVEALRPAPTRRLRVFGESKRSVHCG